MRSISKLVFVVLVACGSNATTFEGSAKFPDGTVGCRRECEDDGLEMGGFVYSGRFSTSCVCTPKQSAPGAAASSTSPTAGVIVQAQAAAAAAAASQQMMATQQMQQQRMQHR